VRLLPESPRKRRRLFRLGAVAVACIAVGIVFVLLPNTNGLVKSHFSNQPVQRVVVERQVPVTRARRSEVNSLFDAFVPSAVERHDPRTAYALVTPAFRAGVTRREWLSGQMPVYPYDARGTSFHGWTVDDSFRNSMSVELDLQPEKRADGPIAVNVDLKRVKGRWLIDSFYPRTSYAPTAVSAKQGPAGARSATSSPAPADTPTHTSLMWVFLACVFGVIVLTPIAIVSVSTFRNRRAARRAI
jgi:hypothetical protein